jgi:ferredoxin
MLVIDPAECIDCTLCVPECPVEAIYAEDDVPDAQKEFIALNASSRRSGSRSSRGKPAPPDADEWAKTKEKKHLLEKLETAKSGCSNCSRQRSNFRTQNFCVHTTTVILKCHSARTCQYF